MNTRLTMVVLQPLIIDLWLVITIQVLYPVHFLYYKDASKVWVKSFQVAICKLSVRNCTSSGKRQQQQTKSKSMKLIVNTPWLPCILQQCSRAVILHTPVSQHVLLRQGIFSKPKGAANEWFCHRGCKLCHTYYYILVAGSFVTSLWV